MKISRTTGSMEKIKCDNHEIKTQRALCTLGGTTVTKARVKEVP
jgi:hypothetical protein